MNKLFLLGLTLCCSSAYSSDNESKVLEIWNKPETEKFLKMHKKTWYGHHHEALKKWENPDRNTKAEILKSLASKKRARFYNFLTNEPWTFAAWSARWDAKDLLESYKKADKQKKKIYRQYVQDALIKHDVIVESAPDWLRRNLYQVYQEELGRPYRSEISELLPE